MHGLAPGTVCNLVPATRAIRRDKRTLRSLSDRRQQANLGHLHRRRVVLGLVSEASRHAAATRLNMLYLRSRNHFQHRIDRRHGVEGLLMAMPMDKDGLIERRELQPAGLLKHEVLE